MKTMRKIGMMLMTAMVAFGMTACDVNDDNAIATVDNPDAKGVSMTINGTTFSVYNAYWDVNVANGNDTFYTLQFYNFAALGTVDPMDIITIVYKVTGGSQTAITTGEFSDFEVSVTKVSSNSSLDKEYYTYGTDNNAKLKVTKSGGGYQVDFGAMKYTDGNSTTTYDGTAFSFTGSFTKGTLLQVQ